MAAMAPGSTCSRTLPDRYCFARIGENTTTMAHRSSRSPTKGGAATTTYFECGGHVAIVFTSTHGRWPGGAHTLNTERSGMTAVRGTVITGVLREQATAARIALDGQQRTRRK